MNLYVWYVSLFLQWLILLKEGDWDAKRIIFPATRMVDPRKKNHEKQLAAIDRRCECLSDKNYEKTPAVCRMLEDLKISASFEMEMIMEIDEALSGQLACA